MGIILYAVLVIFAASLIALIFNGISFLLLAIKNYIFSFYCIAFFISQVILIPIPCDTNLVQVTLFFIISVITYVFDIHPVITFIIYVILIFIIYITSDFHNNKKKRSTSAQNISEKQRKEQQRQRHLLGLQCWKKLFTFTYLPPREEKIILAGRRGETFLKNYIASHEKFRDSHVFTARRLENIAEKGRKEIDMIIVTDRKIYVIECKNWSGNLYIDGDTWLHKNVVEGNQTVTNTYDANSNPINLNRSKASLLYYTLWGNGFQISEQDIVSKVILMNRNLTVRGQSKAPDDLILFKDLDPYLSKQDTRVQTSLTEKIILSILSLCLDERHFPIVADTISPCLGGEKRTAMLQFLQDLPSWDYLYLAPNAVPAQKAARNMPFKVFQGDLLYWSNIPVFHESIHYQDIKSVRVHKHRKKLPSLVLTLLGGYPLVLHITMKDGTIQKVCADPDGSILFHEAGQKKARQCTNPDN